VDLVTQRVPDLPAPLSQFGADADHLVWLSDGEFGDTSFRPPATQLAPASVQGAVAQFHDRLEGKQDRPGLDQRSVAVSNWIGTLSKSQLMTIVSTTTLTERASVMPRPAPPGTPSTHPAGRR